MNEVVNERLRAEETDPAGDRVGIVTRGIALAGLEGKPPAAPAFEAAVTEE